MGLIVFMGLPHTIVSLRVWALYNNCHEYFSTDVVSNNLILPGLFHLVAFLVLLTQPGHMAGLRDRVWTIVSHCCQFLIMGLIFTLHSVGEASVCMKLK